MRELSEVSGAKGDEKPVRGNRVARVVQFTDCHLGPTSEYCLAGVRTLNSFREVIADILGDRDLPDVLLATGDIAAHGKAEAYKTFTTIMEETAMSYAWLPGNHDDFMVMMEETTASPYWPMLELADWCLISLNSAVPGRVEGKLDAAELEFLNETLSANKDRFVALFMHHPPMNIGCQWLDRQQVANGDELAEIIRVHGNVRAIFTGHVHQQGSHRFRGIPLYTTPSTCFQFTPQRKDFAVDTLPPGYRWINLYDNGHLETDVVWIENTAEVVDTEVNGY